MVGYDQLCPFKIYTEGWHNVVIIIIVLIIGIDVTYASEVAGIPPRQ